MVFAAATSDPYLTIDYNIARPDVAPIKTDEPCPLNAGRHFLSRKTPGGRSVNINLCLLTMSFGKESAQLIPYKIEQSGIIWGAASYSNEIDAYEREIEKRFVLPSSDAQWADREISRLYRETLLRVLGYLRCWACCVLDLWFCVSGGSSVVSWEFPRGQDHRQSDA
nr:putative integron gene cassette protein [uncultured bacterium]